jgi:hypothetical protein
MPNLWSLNYYLPSMMEGFYRRSLAGSFLFFLGDLRFQYHVIASLQIAIFICLNIVIICAWTKQEPLSKWLLPLFLVSPAGGYFFHEIGYIEQLLYFLLFVAIIFRNPIFGTIVIAGSLLFHEIALFTTIPLYVGYLIINKRPKSEVWSVVLSSLLLFGVLYIFFQTVNSVRLNSFIDVIRTSANYPVRLSYYEVFSNQFVGPRSQWYYSVREMWNSCLLIPLWAMSGYLFSQNKNRLNNRINFLLGFVCASSPMLLGLFGWDCSRWMFLSIASSFCCFYFSKKYISSSLIFIISINVLAFGLFGFLDYFDLYYPRLSNFAETTKFLQGGFLELLVAIPQRF